MKMKRLAVRAAVVLAVVVALCMFFGQTILTLTTPKVKLVTAASGRLEDRIKVSAELYFEQPESYTLEAARDQPVTVDQVYVSVGDSVVKGDILFTCTLGAKYDEALKAQRDALDKARSEQVAVDLATSGAKLKNTGKNDAEDRFYKAAGDHIAAMTDLVELTIARGIELTDDVDSWPSQIGARMTPEISLQFDELARLKKIASEAKARLMAIHKNGKIEDNTYDSIKKRREARVKVRDENEKFVKLIEQGESLKTIRATRPGVVLALDVKAGEGYGGDKPAYQLSATGPVLRADVSEVRKQLSKDMRVDYKTEYDTIKTQIIDVRREAGGKKYAVIALTDELLDAAGGLRELTSLPIEVTIVYKAKSNTTLLPESAVKGNENDYYVLVADPRYGMWGMQLVARKQNVKVVEHSDRVWSVEEDLSYQKIITQPNAPVEDGTRVMEYE